MKYICFYLNLTYSGDTAAVYDSLLNLSQEGAGFHTQMAIAKSLSEVIVHIVYE